MAQLEARSYPEVDPGEEYDREMFGPVDPITKTNSRLTTALIAVTSLLLVAVVGLVGSVFYFEHRPVRVISLNKAGQVESFLLNTTGFTLHSRETQAALKNGITSWAEGFFSRVRNPLNGEAATTAYPNSFIFLGSGLSQAYRRKESTEHEIAAFISGSDPEYRVIVQTVVFRNLDRLPYAADVYYEKDFYSQPLQVASRKMFIVPIQFSANPGEEELQQLEERTKLDIDALMKINPLVIAITSIGEPTGFSNTTEK